jgi:hypothetical protein
MKGIFKNTEFHATYCRKKIANTSAETLDLISYSVYNLTEKLIACYSFQTYTLINYDFLHLSWMSFLETVYQGKFWFLKSWTSQNKLPSPFQRGLSMTTFIYFVRFEVFTAMTMKNGVFWVVTSVLTRATRRNNPEDTILHLLPPFWQENMTNWRRKFTIPL